MRPKVAWIRHRLLLFLCVAGAALPCASAASPQADLHDRIHHLAYRYGICDVAVAVVRNRELQSVDAAHTCAGQVPAAEESVFEAASLSKPLFAYAVLKLVQEGKMSLDAPLLSYLPQGYAHRHFAHRPDSPIDQVSDPALSAVTVRMAMNHTSGLANWSNGPLAFTAKPGARWQYSGEGYVLLQRAVETVTGEPLDKYMERTVFRPLAMTHSSYTHNAGLENAIVSGTNFYDEVLPNYPFREAVAAYSLYTSAGDYGRFLAALLSDPALLRQTVDSPASLDAKPGLGWGLGWGLERRACETYLWHWGNNSGYRAFVMVSAQSGDGFVMLTNSDKGLALAEPLGEQLLPGPHPVYRLHFLRDGLANYLCEKVDICL